jgi:hypothetical protein
MFGLKSGVCLPAVQNDHFMRTSWPGLALVISPWR